MPKLSEIMQSETNNYKEDGGYVKVPKEAIARWMRQIDTMESLILLMKSDTDLMLMKLSVLDPDFVETYENAFKTKPGGVA